MKVAHVSISSGGGAGIAAGRSMQAITQLGWAAVFYTADAGGSEKVRNQRLMRPRVMLDRALNRFYPHRNFYSSWSNNWLPSSVSTILNRGRFDIVHVHWIGGAFMSLPDLGRIDAPVCWTLHDTWAFTGGCHYPGACSQFETGCGSCPQLGSDSHRDLSRYNRRTKARHASNVDAFIAPSEWLAGMALRSNIVPSDRLFIIPNGVDGSRFAPRDGSICRQELGIPEEAIVVAAGAANLEEHRKGCHLLKPTLSRIVSSVKKPCILVLFGEGDQHDHSGWGCDVVRLGTLHHDHEFARIFSAADFFLLPSLQDNLPNIAVEAHACGCPVVGFNSGGLVEIIEAGITGEVASAFSSESLAKAALTWLGRNSDRRIASVRVRARFESKFSMREHGIRLNGVYRKLLTDAPGGTDTKGAS